MLNWIKNINREYPEFWKLYLAKFETKPNRYVVLNTETTGLNPKKDVILSFGSIGIVNDVIKIIKNKKNKDEVIDVNTLAKVTYLREICDSANLVDKNINESSKINEL